MNSKTPLDTLRELVSLYSSHVSELESKLSVSILVDAGMILVMRERDGNERIYGHFPPSLMAPKDAPKVKGWLSANAISNHLCGCSMFTRENAERNLRTLRANPDEGCTYSARHYRDELQRRLDEARAMLAAFSPKVAELESAAN